MLIPFNPNEEFNTNRLEAEGFVQSALDALSAHVAILNADGNIIGINTAWRDFAINNGYSEPHYGLGENYLAVCDRAAKANSKDALLVAAGIREVIEGTAQDFQLEYPCHSPHERRWFVIRVSRFDWYDEMRLIVAHQNISELKRVQIQWEKSNHRLEAILNHVNDAIITIDPKGDIQTVNEAATQVFEYENDEFTKLHLNDLITEPVRGKAALRRLNSGRGREITGKRKSGQAFPIYFMLKELRLDDGSVYTCFIQDLTARKRMEAEIIERERVQIALEKERELRTLKDRFLSMMGHELNTPLASISLSYDMLKKYGDVSTPEENEQALDNIQIQVEHLRDMVKDVMTFSRSESEGLSIDLEPADLITYCRDVVEEFQFTYHQTHQVEFECDELDIRAQLDRKLLRRALTNLLSNAIKYSPEGGKVTFKLSVNHDAEQAVIQVIDCGIGIPKADHGRLFEPFHRADNVNTLPGTGLGLAIVKQTIELHQGEIYFESHMGQGTTFTIHLPLRIQDQ